MFRRGGTGDRAEPSRSRTTTSHPGPKRSGAFHLRGQSKSGARVRLPSENGEGIFVQRNTSATSGRCYKQILA